MDISTIYSQTGYNESSISEKEIEEISNRIGKKLSDALMKQLKKNMEAYRTKHNAGKDKKKNK